MKGSTVVIVAAGAFIGYKILSKQASQVASQVGQNVGQGIGQGLVNGVVANVSGALKQFAGLFSATGSGSTAPQNIGSGAGNYPFKSPSLGDYTLAAPYDSNSVVGIEATLRDPGSFQLHDTGIWAASSSFGGSPMPNYNGNVYGSGVNDFQLGATDFQL
jgi:hypothetical protein